MSEPNWVALGQSAVAIDYVGTWAAGTPYKTGDVVVYNGVQYIAVNPSTGQTPPAAALVGIPASLLDAKGDLIVASADNVVARLAVGANGQALVADSAQAAGVKWADPTPGWASYTPTWTATATQPALGNGTFTGRYIQIGKFVYCNMQLTLGSTSTQGTGAWYFGLPVAATAAGVPTSHGSGFAGIGAGPLWYPLLTRQEGGSKITLWTVASATLGSGSPAAFVAGNFVQASIVYEAA